MCYGASLTKAKPTTKLVMRGSLLKVLTLTTMVHVQEMSHFIHYSCECVNDSDHEIWKIELFNPWIPALNTLDVNFFN